MIKRKTNRTMDGYCLNCRKNVTHKDCYRYAKTWKCKKCRLKVNVMSEGSVVKNCIGRTICKGEFVIGKIIKRKGVSCLVKG